MCSRSRTAYVFPVFVELYMQSSSHEAGGERGGAFQGRRVARE